MATIKNKPRSQGLYSGIFSMIDLNLEINVDTLSFHSSLSPDQTGKLSCSGSSADQQSPGAKRMSGEHYPAGCAPWELIYLYPHRQPSTDVPACTDGRSIHTQTYIKITLIVLL